MPSTLVELVLLLAFLLPGFVFVQAVRHGRAYQAARSDLEFSLRALAVALGLQVIAFPWTASVVRSLQRTADARNAASLHALTDLSGGPISADIASAYRPPVSAFDVWPSHVWELALYGAVVIVGGPLVLGLFIGKKLREKERGDQPASVWTSVFGATSPPQAWDTLASQLGGGGYVVVRLKDGGAAIGGLFGKRSYASHSPSSPDILLEELYWLDANGNPLAPVQPRRSAWIPGERIEALIAVPYPYENLAGQEPQPGEKA